MRNVADLDAPDYGTTLNAISSLAAVAGPKTRRLITGAVLTSAVYEATKRVWDKMKAKSVYVVTVTQGDAIYSELHVRLLQMLSSSSKRALMACTERDDRYQPIDGGGPPRVGRLSLFFDGTLDQVIHLDGHEVTVTLTKPEMAVSDLMRENMGTSNLGREKLCFRTHSEGGRDAILALLAEVVADHYRKKRSRFMVASQWGGWDDRQDLPSRELDTVVLRAGQKERLVDDLARFFAQEADYARLGTPWHRGVLLHGPPGTGKTSIAKALACHFDLDVYYVPIGDLKSDTSLLQLCAQVRPRSMLLLEDVDILQAATTREEEQGRTSLSGLLNALDGVSTPHGLITVMTTNDTSKLDSALIRPGRVDVVEEVSYLDDAGLADLFFMAFDEKVNVPTLAGIDVTPAEVMEVFKRNLDAPSVAEVEVAALVRRCES